jgi:hypothetical protein
MPARVNRSGVEAYPSSESDVQARYGAALAAQPLPPAQFTLFFVEGKDEFTDESKKIVDSVFAEIAKRPVPDVIVIGHTDTVATTPPTTRCRASGEVVRSLRRRGLAADKVVVIGAASASWRCHRRRCLEARNRRVEILALKLAHRPLSGLQRRRCLVRRRTVPAHGQEGQVIVRLGAVGEGQRSLQRGDELARAGAASDQVDDHTSARPGRTAAACPGPR